jgi:YfiH family protein
VSEADAWLEPDWPAPQAVRALLSLRDGGVSGMPWRSMNVGRGVGDDEAAVAANRERFERQLGARPAWLRQVHGANVLHLDPASAGTDLDAADAAWTEHRGIACTVLVADCMPVLFALRDGRAVAAAHAGWRGLAGGVLEATLAALHAGVGARAEEVLAWLGPCIGPDHFEVGADVLQAFGHDAEARHLAHFAFTPRADGSARWHADLQGLARERLQAAGVRQIAVQRECTVCADSRWFSFRRDGVTGRMAAAVWLR